MKHGIRLVAVDEDGTFLRDHVRYDERRFARLYGRMREQGVRFVVATGNQHYQVQELFAPYVGEMGIVAHNGSYVLDGGEEVFATRVAPEALAIMREEMRAHPEVPFSLLGVHGAYVERSAPQEFFDDMATYCFRQSWVGDLLEVDDQLLMFSSVVAPDEVDRWVSYFRRALTPYMEVVGSGDGYFDVVCPGVNKASGLRRLMARWHIAPEEVMAFGDSDNDLEMLALAGRGYAMQNASARVREAADFVAPPCSEDGVLAVIEELL